MTKMVTQKDVILALLSSLLTITLFVILPIRSAPSYDPWLDINNDGVVDMRDIGAICSGFGGRGGSVTKALINYDSGWINITDKAGQYISIAHNLNSTDMIVDITGKRAIDGGVHQMHYGLMKTEEITQGFSKTYGGTGNDEAFCVIQTNDGGYALVGWTNYDAWLVKTDSNGTTQWQKTYGGVDYDRAYCLAQTGDGGYVLTGYTYSYGSGSGDVWLIKTNPDGVEEWSKTYGGVDIDVARSITLTKDGGYALVGYTLSFGAGDFDAWLIKTDLNGVEEWNKTYGGADFDATYSGFQMNDGSYVLAGTTVSSAIGKCDAWLVKTDSNGNFEWSKAYGGEEVDEAYSVIQTNDDRYLLCGRTESSGAGNSDAWLIKTDLNGVEEWNKTYGGADFDATYCVIQVSNGGYALAGSTSSTGAGKLDGWLVRTDLNGDIEWEKTFGMSDDDKACCLIQTGLDSYTLAGVTGYYDAWLFTSDYIKITGESGLAWFDSTADTIILYRGLNDPYWNFVRVRVWETNENP